MSLQLNLTFAALLPLTGAEGYFTYTDCSHECKSRNFSCTISADGNDFLSQCFESALACSNEANRLRTCLRKNLPPLGGELLWLRYKQTHTNPDKPKPNYFFENCPLLISTIFNIIFALTTLTLSAILIQRIRSTKIRYRNMNATSTNSLPDSPDFPKTHIERQPLKRNDYSFNQSHPFNPTAKLRQ